MTTIYCSGSKHGTWGEGPALGTVENHTNPNAPYGYLCAECTQAHVDDCVARGVSPTIPPVTPQTHLVRHPSSGGG